MIRPYALVAGADVPEDVIDTAWFAAFRHSATAHTSHLLAAPVQFLTEMLLMEVAVPQMRRVRSPEPYDVPLLQF